MIVKRYYISSSTSFYGGRIIRTTYWLRSLCTHANSIVTFIWYFVEFLGIPGSFSAKGRKIMFGSRIQLLCEMWVLRLTPGYEAEYCAKSSSNAIAAREVVHSGIQSIDDKMSLRHSSRRLLQLTGIFRHVSRSRNPNICDYWFALDPRKVQVVGVLWLLTSTSKWDLQIYNSRVSYSHYLSLFTIWPPFQASTGPWWCHQQMRGHGSFIEDRDDPLRERSRTFL